MDCFKRPEVQIETLDHLLHALGHTGEMADIESVVTEIVRHSRSDSFYTFALINQGVLLKSDTRRAVLDDNTEAILTRGDASLSNIDVFQENPDMANQAVEIALQRLGYRIEVRRLGSGESFSVVLVRHSEIATVILVHVESDKNKPLHVLLSQMDRNVRNPEVIALMYRWMGTDPDLIQRFGGRSIYLLVSEPKEITDWLRQGLYDSNYRPYTRGPIVDKDIQHYTQDLYLLTGTFPQWPGKRGSLNQEFARQRALERDLEERKIVSQRLKRLNQFVEVMNYDTLVEVQGRHEVEGLSYAIRNKDGQTLFVTLGPRGVRSVRFSGDEAILIDSLPQSFVDEGAKKLLKYVTFQQVPPYVEVGGESLYSHHQNIHFYGLLPAAALRQPSITQEDFRYVRNPSTLNQDIVEPFNQSIQVYKKLRETNSSLSDLMEPLTRPIALFDGEVMAPTTRIREVDDILVGLNIMTLQGSQSPYVAIFYLRHAMDRVIGSKAYSDIALRDAAFLRRLKEILPAQEYQTVSRELRRLMAIWKDKHDYVEFLEYDSQTENDEGRRQRFALYLAERILVGHRQPVWEVTLTPTVYDLFPRVAQWLEISRQRLMFEIIPELLLGAVLTRAGVRERSRRSRFANLFRDEKNLIQWNAFQSSKLKAWESQLYGQDDPGPGIEELVRVSRAANAIWSDLNLPLGFDGTPEREPFLRLFSSHLEDTVASLDPEKGRFLYAENRMQRIRVRLPQAFKQGREDELENEVVRILWRYPQLAVDFGPVFAAIVQELGQDYLEYTRRFAERVGSSLPHPEVLQGFIKHVTSGKLVLEIRALFNHIQQSAKLLEVPGLSARDLSRLEWIALRAHQANEKKFRKDGRPYSVHLLQVVATTVDVYHEFRLLALALDFLHDTFEDNPRSAIQIFEDIESAVGPLQDLEFKNMLHLMVRMMTVEKRAGESERQFLERYYAGLRNPKLVYKDEPAAASMSKDEHRIVIIGKMADNNANANDFPYAEEDGKSLGPTLIALPGITFEKIVTYVIPLLVNHLEIIGIVHQGDIEAYYATQTKHFLHALEVDIQAHPQAIFLQEAALKTIPRLEKLMRENYFFKGSSILKQKADELHEGYARISLKIREAA